MDKGAGGVDKARADLNNAPIKGIPDWSQTIIGGWKQEGNTLITSPSGNRWKIEDGVLNATNSKGEPLRYVRK